MNENQYLNMLRNTLETGTVKTDRTGTGTISNFGGQMSFDLRDGKIPVLTTKKVFWKAVVVELLWLLRGNTSADFLDQHNITIWKEWTNSDNDLPNVYPKQWRKWWTLNGPVDQIANAIDQIKNNPDSRRIVVSAWNAGKINDMALPPCHAFFQFYVNNGELSCHLYQRSGDMFLGVPFNIASYSLLTHLIAHECGLKAGDFIHSLGDRHIYLNHVDQVKEQLTRFPMQEPTIKINIDQPLLDFVDNCDNLTWDEIKQKIVLQNYKSHGSIKAEVAI